MKNELGHAAVAEMSIASGGYQLKAGHFPPFWLYGNSTIKQNLRNY